MLSIFNGFHPSILIFDDRFDPPRHGWYKSCNNLCWNALPWFTDDDVFLPGASSSPAGEVCLFLPSAFTKFSAGLKPGNRLGHGIVYILSVFVCFCGVLGNILLKLCATGAAMFVSPLNSHKVLVIDLKWFCPALVLSLSGEKETCVVCSCESSPKHWLLELRHKKTHYTLFWWEDKINEALILVSFNAMGITFSKFLSILLWTFHECIANTARENNKQGCPCCWKLSQMWSLFSHWRLTDYKLETLTRNWNRKKAVQSSGTCDVININVVLISNMVKSLNQRKKEVRLQEQLIPPGGIFLTSEVRFS